MSALHLCMMRMVLDGRQRRTFRVAPEAAVGLPARGLCGAGAVVCSPSRRVNPLLLDGAAWCAECVTRAQLAWLAEPEAYAVPAANPSESELAAGAPLRRGA